MAYTSDKEFSSFQGRAPSVKFDDTSFRRRMRLPFATLALGLVAAMAIAGGGLDRLIAMQTTAGLQNLEFLTGELPKDE